MKPLAICWDYRYGPICRSEGRLGTRSTAWDSRRLEKSTENNKLSPPFVRHNGRLPARRKRLPYLCQASRSQTFANTTVHSTLKSISEIDVCRISHNAVKNTRDLMNCNHQHLTRAKKLTGNAENNWRQIKQKVDWRELWRNINGREPRYLKTTETFARFSSIEYETKN